MATRTNPNCTITTASSPEDIVAVEELIKAHCTSSTPPLSAHEIGHLPGAYAPPTGALLLARSCFPSTSTSTDAATIPLGLIALKCPDYLPSHICEMHRLYVSPGARGLGLGKALVGALLREARTLGYEGMRLGVFEANAGAVRLYRDCGFTTRERYKPTVYEGLVFFEIDLRGGGGK